MSNELMMFLIVYVLVIAILIHIIGNNKKLKDKINKFF